MEILIAVAALLGVGLGFWLGRRSRASDPQALAAATAQAIAANAEQFMQQAGDQVGPLVEPLRAELDHLRTAYDTDKGALTEQLRAQARFSQDLLAQTQHLTHALRGSGEQRGTWGEMQLRRVVELAGMTEHVDFDEQTTLATGRGRPDLTIRLPNERRIAVDAKAPLKAYVEALDAESDAERRQGAAAVARQVRDRALELATKGYQHQLPHSVDFVIMFLPGEHLLPLAVRENAALLDELVQRNVLIATPLTLIAMLRAVAVGWREAQIADDAQAIADIGGELHTKIATYVEHVANQGRGLERALKSYNAGVGTLTGRGGLIGLAEKLEAKGVAAKKRLPDVRSIERDARRP